jgi:ApbE superfamily uncharacterized protein (UPF0280 family)
MSGSTTGCRRAGRCTGALVGVSVGVGRADAVVGVAAGAEVGVAEPLQATAGNSISKTPDRIKVMANVLAMVFLSS